MVSADDTLLSVHDKAFPPDAWGLTAAQFAASHPALSSLQTPVVTLDRSALAHNVRTMFAWVHAEGLHLAPHGKTTMSPPLWHQLIEAGAWGLTLATTWQAQVARHDGIRRIMIANGVTDPVGLRWIAGELASHPDVEISCWVDSVAGVHTMEAALHGSVRPVPVIVDLGAVGGRTGARTVAAGVAVAQAVHASAVLELAGVGGYEGSLAHDRSDAAVARVDAYLDALAELHRQTVSLHRDGGRPVVTAGGSAYFDRVAARLESVRDTADIVLRSGAFQVHDDGHYAGISPMGAILGDAPFRSAMHAWLRVVSHPEPGLVILDGGKRDVSFDEGMPVPQRVVGLSAADSDRALHGAAVTRLNDQHAYLTLAPDAAAEPLVPGAVVRLGLSHPCTVLDRWRMLPVIDDADAETPAVVDAVPTLF